MEGKLVRLRPRTAADEREDAERAQNDPELALLDPAAGKVYSMVRLSIETLDGYYLGVCGLYNLEGTRIQLGIRINDNSYWNLGYGTEAVNLLVSYGFTLMPGVSCIRLKVLPTNARAIACYTKCGFVPCGRLPLSGYDFVTMEVTREGLQ